MYFIGIDPGAKGALSVIDNDGKFVSTSVYSVYKYREIVENIAHSGKPCFAYIEKVHAMPKQGVSSCFTFGKNVGWIEGLLYANRISCEEVPPQVWMRHFNLLKPHGGGGKRDKSLSIDKAHELFGGVSFLPTERCTKESDGIAESLLIAEYGRSVIYAL